MDDQPNLRSRPVIRAVLWDFGGVILTSPFDAFAAYEREIGLPEGFIRQVNASNPDANAWARMERNELDVLGFADAFEAEARALGGELDGRRVVALLSGDLRPEMVEALHRLRGRFRLACLTNNVANGAVGDRRPEVLEVLDLFDFVVESSKVGIRKPEPRFYELACELLEVEPDECVFLDDLGVNLKPARAMGMATIKVTDPAAALDELEALVGIPLR
jgi:putative hydrolase of the HAD superfamily